MQTAKIRGCGRWLQGQGAEGCRAAGWGCEVTGLWDANCRDMGPKHAGCRAVGLTALGCSTMVPQSVGLWDGGLERCMHTRGGEAGLWVAEVQGCGLWECTAVEMQDTGTQGCRMRDARL